MILSGYRLICFSLLSFFPPPFLWLFTGQMYVEVRSVRSESSHLSMSWSSSILLHFSKFLLILRWLIFPFAGILLGIKRVRLVVRAPSQNGEKRLPCLLNGTLFCHVLYLSILYLLWAHPSSEPPGVILSLAPWLPGCVDECGWSVLWEGNGAVSPAISLCGVSFCSSLRLGPKKNNISWRVPDG